MRTDVTLGYAVCLAAAVGSSKSLSIQQRRLLFRIKLKTTENSIYLMRKRNKE
jgi:hypothetical protein